MFKQICLLTRRADMAVPDFEAYYENNHASLAASLMPNACHYQRRFVRHAPGPIAENEIPIGFDCMTELWWETRDAFEKDLQLIGTGEGNRRLYADEENLFASHDNPICSVEEYETPLQGWSEGEALFKQVHLLKRRSGLSLELFRERLENDYAVVEGHHIGRARRVLRRYVQPERNAITGVPIELPFDVIVEVWWGSRTECVEGDGAVVRRGRFQGLGIHGESIFALPQHRLFSVEERETDLSRSVPFPC